MAAPTNNQIKQAAVIFDVLVRLARASQSDLSQFAYFYAERGGRPGGGDDEFRFGGSLGFGGKIWWSRRRGWSVNCYREDETPARLETIKAVYEALAKFNTADQNMRQARGW